MLLVISTFDDQEKAVAVSKTLVQEKLAACVQIDGPVTSVYHWQGKLEQSAEWRISAKTLGLQKESLIRRLQELHPYDVPEIIVQEVECANPAYHKWMTSNLNSKEDNE